MYIIKFYGQSGIYIFNESQLRLRIKLCEFLILHFVCAIYKKISEGERISYSGRTFEFSCCKTAFLFTNLLCSHIFFDTFSSFIQYSWMCLYNFIKFFFGKKILFFFFQMMLPIYDFFF